MKWIEGDRFEGLILETCQDKNRKVTRPRVSPLEDSDIVVKFPRELRKKYPLHTRFRANVVVSQKRNNGVLNGGPYLVAETKSIVLVENYMPEINVYPIQVSERGYEYVIKNIELDPCANLRQKAYENATDKVGFYKKTGEIKSRIQNPLVHLYILKRAKGYCEACGEEAPFLRRNGEPYLEIHHIVEVSKGGADSPKNVAALCPNCHRRVTSGSDAEEYNAEIKKKILNKEL